MMKIYYDTQDEMLDLVQGLVMRGLTFEVNTETKVIILTGGY